MMVCLDNAAIHCHCEEPHSGDEAILQVIIQVVPSAVHAVDQINFLPPRAALDLLLTRNGRTHIIEHFVVDQFGDIVVSGEPFNQLFSMLQTLFFRSFVTPV